VFSVTAKPPSSIIPTSKETLVRVEDFSNIMARTFPFSGWKSRSRFFFISSAVSNMSSMSFWTSSMVVRSRFIFCTVVNIHHGDDIDIAGGL